MFVSLLNAETPAGIQKSHLTLGVQVSSFLVSALGTELSTLPETKINTEPDCKGKTAEDDHSTEIVPGSDPQLSKAGGTKPILHHLNAPDVIKRDRKRQNCTQKFLVAFPLAGSHPEHAPTSKHASTRITLFLACSINSRGAFPN